jgi:hypothetical protein
MLTTTIMSMAIVLVGVQKAPVDTAKESAQKLAKACAEATIKKDLAKVIDLTHPMAVAAMGGRRTAIKIAEEELKKAEQDGVKMLSVAEVLLPKKIYPSAKAHYCVVPVSFHIKVDDSKYLLRSALIGISIDAGKTWKFVDISLGEEAVRKLLPDMPKELDFPPKAEAVPESKEADR